MEEKSQAVRVDEVRFEIEEDSAALKSLTEGISKAVRAIGNQEELARYQDKAPCLCEDIEKMTSLVDGFCVSLRQLADRLDDTMEKTEKIWAELAEVEVKLVSVGG